MAVEVRRLNAEVFRSIVERAPAGVCVSERVEGGDDFLVLYVSEACQALKPFRPMTGRTYREVWPELADSVVPHMLEVLQTGTPWTEHELPVHAETAPGVTRLRYLWIEVSRLEVDGGGLLLSIATDITEAVEARRREGQELETTKLLLDAADALNSWTDLDVLLQTLAETVLRSVGHRRVLIGLLSEDGLEMRFAAAAGDAPVTADHVVPVPQASSALREVLASGKTRIADYEALPEAERGAAERYGMRFALMVPLVFRRWVLGYIGVDDPDERCPFSEREIEVVEGIAAQAAVAIENARLFETERERSERLLALVEVGELVNSSLESIEVIKRALESTERHLGVVASSVWTLNGDGRRLALVGARGFPHAFFEDFAEGLDVGAPFPVTTAFRLSAPQLYEEIGPGLHRPVREAYARYGIELGSLAAMPLVARGRTIGGLTLAWKERRRLGPADVVFMTALATRFSGALENARLYQDERQVADTLQEALLTLPDEIEGLDFAHAYRSAAEIGRVGGDFCDLFELENGRLGITVGDVAGKGLEASVLTSLVKNAVRAEALEPLRTPAEVMETVNTLVLRSSGPEVFVTVFFGVLDRSSGSLRYCSAGHTTGALVPRSRGDVAVLAANSPIAGALPEAAFADSETRVGSGDMLFLYTDGLTEARSPGGELFEEERLLSLLSETRGGDAAATVRAVVDAVHGFTSGRLADDMAILALRQLPSEGG